MYPDKIFISLLTPPCHLQVEQMGATGATNEGLLLRQMISQFTGENKKGYSNGKGVSLLPSVFDDVNDESCFLLLIIFSIAPTSDMYGSGTPPCARGCTNTDQKSTPFPKELVFPVLDRRGIQRARKQ